MEPTFQPGHSFDNHKSNRLAGSTSPYLLQHQWNPVDWYPWSEEAIQRAVFEQKPIFLSIGYSACHWCHVMERESFEDESIGAYLAEHFIAIKVDREQRPDLDQVYMQALQMMTGSGGWPMSIFLTPECKPFYCGTYWPPVPRWGKPSFRQVLKAVVDAWQSRRPDLEEQAEQLVDSIGSSTVEDRLAEASSGCLDESTLRQAAEKMLESFDPEYGGFSRAPKFPSPMALQFLMRIERRQPDDRRRLAILKTLDSMAAGGIFDHLGGGFSRYSVDEKWMVPHFEKMLYDNALLAGIYVEAFGLFGEPCFRAVAERTLNYLLSDLRHGEGGFFSAEDADSEGVEGKFYVWTKSEIQEVLGPQQAELFCAVYDVTESGNFEGKSVLHLIVSPLFDQPVKIDQASVGRAPDRRCSKIEMVASRLAIPIDELNGRLAEMRALLLSHRAKRVRPGLDDKVLLAWNALALEAFARASVVLAKPEYLRAALEGYAFLRSQLRRPDGRWFHVWRDGRAEIDAFLDDYAYLANALLTLYESSGEKEYLEESKELVARIREEFSDIDRAGYFYTSAQSELLVARVKEWTDHSLPSGNAMVATIMARLVDHMDDDGYRLSAERIVQATQSWMERSPHAVGQMLIAADLLVTPVEKRLLLVRSLDDPRLLRLTTMLRAECSTRIVLSVVSMDQLKDVPGHDDKELLGSRVVSPNDSLELEVWLSICRGNICLPPIVGWEAIEDWMTKNSQPPTGEW